VADRAQTVLACAIARAEIHLYDGVTAVHEPCGHELKLQASCDHCAKPVPPGEVSMKYRRREAARAVGAAM